MVVVRVEGQSTPTRLYVPNMCLYPGARRATESCGLQGGRSCCLTGDTAEMESHGCSQVSLE